MIFPPHASVQWQPWWLDNPHEVTPGSRISRSAALFSLRAGGGTSSASGAAPAHSTGLLGSVGLLVVDRLPLPRVCLACKHCYEQRSAGFPPCICVQNHRKSGKRFSRKLLKHDPNVFSSHLKMLSRNHAVRSRLDSLRGSSAITGAIQRRSARPLRKDDAHRSRSVKRRRSTACQLNIHHVSNEEMTAIPQV